MYEINGVPVSEAALIARAEELNITLEELIKRNSEIIVKVGEAPLVAQAVPDGTSIDQAPLNIPESMDPALDYDPITSIQNVTPSEKEIQVRDEKIKSYDQQLKEYNKKIQDILNFPGLSGQQRLDMVNELQTPGTIDLVNEGFSDISNPFLFNESNSVEVQNEYSNNKELVSELQQKIKESNNKEEDYTNIFSESLNSDPLVDARRNFYIKNLQEKVELFKQQLIEKNVYDLTTKAGVELAQKRVNEYYAGLIDESMQSDPVVMQQADKISEMLGIVNTADQKQVARGKSLVYSLSDFGQNYYGKDSWQSDIIAGVENLAVQGQSLTSNSMDVIGAQVDGKRKRIAEEVLSQIATLENEGKGEDEEVEIRVGEKSQNFLQTVDRRPRFNGTIKELKSQMENSLQTASQSLEDNIAQMTEFEEYRALAEQAKFSDGISFRDIMVGLGGSLPQMTAASLGTIATVASGGILAPVAGALTFGGGALVTAQFYGENYIEGVKESMLADKEKYPDGITEEALGKAITSGEYDNVAQDLATAALMARLEKLGAETTMKAFFKSMGVSYKSGVKSLFRGDIKKIIKDMGKGVVKQTPNSIIEGLTEVGQSTLQALNTGTKQGDLFKYVNGENNWEEFLAGVTIGTVLPFGGAVATQTRAELRTTAMKVAKEFNPKGNLAQTEMFYKTVLADLKKQKDNGVLSEQEYQDQVEEISSIRNAGLKVPGNFSKRARGESLDLMVEKQRILKEIEGLEPELVVEQKLRIKEINKRLNNIGKAESIISANKKVANQLSDDVIDEFKTFENQEEMLAFLEENGLDPSLAEGRAVEVNIDGKEIALINTEKMTDGVSYFAGAHEILHKFLKNTFNTNPESVYQMANVVKDRLKQLKADPNTNKTLLKGLNDTLNKYKEDSKVSTRDEAEEMITLFSEFVDLGLIAKDKQLGDNLRSASRRFLQNVPGLGKIEFNNANDILNFIADYNKSIKKGRLTRAQRTAAEEGIEISEDLDASVLEADQEREQLQVEANEISSQAKDLEIEQAQQRNASAAELASLFEDDVRTYVTSGRFKIGETPVKDNPKVAGTRDFDTGQSVEGAVEIYDIVSAILYSKRGVVGLVEDYYKKSKEYRDAVTLGQFIGDSRRRDFYRATEIVAPLLGVQSEENVVEEKEDFSKEEKESLRKTMTDLAQELNFDEQSTEKAAIEQAEVESLASDMAEAASKILKGKLKAPTSKEFIQDLQKQSSDLAFKRVKQLMGKAKSEQYTKFIEDYALAILNKTAQTTLNKRFNKLTEPVIDPETGKQARTLTEESRAEGSRVKNPYAGNPKRQLKPDLDVQDMLEYFTPEQGRRDAKQNTLAEVAAFEFVVDAMPEALKTELDDGTTIAERRAELFGQDVVNAEIAYVARELGRGVDYKFAKDLVLDKDLYDEFVDVAKKLVKVVYDQGYMDDDGNYVQAYAEAIEGVSPEIVQAMDLIFEEDPLLAVGGDFIKANLPIIEQSKPELFKAIKNREHVVTSKIKGLGRVINKEAAESLNSFAQRFVKIIDADLIKAFNPTLEIVGYSNRLLDPAGEKRGTGEPGEYNSEYIKARSAKTKKPNNIETSDVMPMNKDFARVSKILNPIFQEKILANKLRMLEEAKAELTNANVANIGLFKNIIQEIQADIKNNNEITDLQLFQFFQLQTGVVKGLRALSRLDYVYLIEGNQFIEGKKRPIKGPFLEQSVEEQNAKIEEFILEFPEFKGRYDIRLQQKLDAGLSLEEAKFEAAFGATLSAYKDLVIKGEHLVPNSVTMTDLYRGIIDGSLTDMSLDEILMGHTQFFGPNYVMDLIDAKGIEGGKKTALTSQEGILRLTKFLKNRPDINSNIYALDGRKAYDQILEQEVLGKKIKVLNNSIKQAKDIDVEMLQGTGVLNVDENMSMEEVLSKAATIDEALRVARDPNAPVKKIRVFDFDDTLALSDNIVKATSPEGEVIDLNAEEFATQGFDLKSKGYEFNFDDFNNVTSGRPGPLFSLAKKIRDSRGNEDLFVLTARAPEAAPAIYEFLKSQGLEIPLKNITGLGNSTGEAKANWVIDKAADGYNDFYFADDATQNVSAVRSALSVVDVKSQVQQAKQAKDLDVDFNKIIEQKTGIGFEKEYSKAKAEVRGAKKNKFQFFIPYSAEDFTGLIYPLISKGTLGDSQLAWFKTNLLDPFSRAQINLQTARLNLMEDFKKLKEDLNVPKDLREEAVDGFTNEQAVRVYLWNKQGIEVPGLSKSDTKELTSIIEDNATLKMFADQLLTINKDPYPSPLKDWLVGNITTDLMRGLKEVKRPEFLQEWQENVDIIFSPKNLNKLEAAYGSKYVEALKNILSRMKSGSNRLQEGNRLSNRILNYINGSNAAIMFFNTRSAILQTISSINFMNWSFNNPVKAGAAFANQSQYWKDFMFLMNSDFLKDRRNGLRINITESEVADAAATSKNKAKGVLNYILSKGYAPTQYADSFAIASGGATYYRNRINDLMKKGSTEAEAKKQAMEEFMELTEENQQSSRPDKISQQQSSDYGRLILMFANTPMQYARLQKRAFQDLMNGRGDSKTNVSKIIYYGFVQNIIFNALQQAVFALGFGDDEEDEAKSKKAYDVANGMADSLLRGIGIGGAAVSVVKNFLLDIYERSGRKRPEYVDSVYELLKFSPPIGSKISRIRQAAWQFDSKKRRQDMMDEGFSMTNPAFLAAGKVVSATTNIPLDRILLKYDNLSSVMDEDTETWQKIALVSGWPKWTLETAEQKATKAQDYLIKDPKGYNAWEQKSILKQFGLKSYEIKRFKNEESRVKEILRLQEENNKNFKPLPEDKPESREEKAARKAEILRKAIEKRYKNK